MNIKSAQSPTFIWAAGIENTFIPHAQAKMRSLDEFKLTQHYDLWQEDLDRIASLGVSHLRWGPPWYRVQSSYRCFEWSWTDQVLERMIAKNITPILDLVHYGTPLWLECSFDDPDYPYYIADYTAAFAERYRDRVRFYTPLNEPLLTAEFCGKLGQWPPYLLGDSGQARLILQLVRGQQLAMERLREIVPNCILVAVEALDWYYSDSTRLQDQIGRLLDFRFVSFDLVTGRLKPQQPAYQYLLDHGNSEAEIEAILANAQRFDWFGVNFYPWSGGEAMPKADGSYRLRRDSLTGRHLEQVLCLAQQKSGLPIMITETSSKGDVPQRARWLAETLESVAHCRANNLPIIGYTWFPVFTMIDWNYRLDSRPLQEHLLHLGLWDCEFDESGILQRHETPLIDEYRRYIDADLL